MESMAQRGTPTLAHGSRQEDVSRKGRPDPVWRTWGWAWVGAAGIGLANATLRELVMRPLVDYRAHQLSTLTLIFFLALYMRWLQTRRPLPSFAVAWQVGVVWAVLTIAFEFGFGHFVAGDSVASLIHNYNFAAGQLWGLVPIWMVVGPALIRRLRHDPRTSALRKTI